MAASVSDVDSRERPAVLSGAEALVRLESTGDLTDVVRMVASIGRSNTTKWSGFKAHTSSNIEV
jgi:hypothetical protein